MLEQLVTLLPQADVLVGFVAPEMRTRNEIARRACETWVGSLPGSRKHHRWFLPAHAMAFRMHDTRGYDLIVSVSHAFEKAIQSARDAVHVCYCLTPPRYLWDLQKEHDRIATPIQRFVLRASRAPLRALDRSFARDVDRFVSLSHYVASRVKRAYGRDSDVVYPPVTHKPSAPVARRGDFLLTLGRLVPYKRVDLAIRAATMLGLPLVVAGDGPERARLERMAGPSIRFVGEVSEEEAGRLLSSCAAFVFCAEEDFGIAPVEANAHGAPVVAYAAGATLETMRDGECAVLFREQTTEAVADAITRCLAASWNPERLRANAERFAPGRFQEGMREQLSAAMQGIQA